MLAVLPDLWSLLMAMAVIVAPLGLAWALLAWSERRKRLCGVAFSPGELPEDAVDVGWV